MRLRFQLIDECERALEDRDRLVERGMAKGIVGGGAVLAAFAAAPSPEASRQ